MKNYKIKNDLRGCSTEEIFESLLSSRGIDDPEHFLYPTEEDLLPLDSLYRIEEAYDRVMQAVNNKERVAILWDTDTDGVTSGTIMTRYLKKFDLECDSYIDNGKEHGINRNDICKFKNYDLLIVVDSLNSGIEEYKSISETTDIIILDHHAINPEIPYDKYAILVSSNRCYDNPQLSGAGVVWKFCKYIDSKQITDYAEDLIDLAATGIVADMMDLTVMENRYIVSTGLDRLTNPAMKKIVGSFDFNSQAISFSIAPIINASNRIGKNEIAVKAFLEDENKPLLGFIRELKKCRELQNNEVDRLMDDVVKQCDAQSDNKVLLIKIDTDYGIAGLIGNKLLEKYQRPLFVVKETDNAYVGSMRAVGLDDFRTIINESGLATAAGHELASGVIIPKDNLDKLFNYFDDKLPELNLSKEIEVDAQINVEDINRTLIDEIKLLDRVSGNGFKPMRFYVNGITDYGIGMMSDYKHLVLKPNDYLWIIKWNFMGDWDEIEDHSVMGDEVSCVCSLDSGFLGRKFLLKAIVDDFEVD